MLHGYHWIVPRADNKLLSLTLDIFGWLVLPTPMFIIGNVTAVTHSFKAEFNKVESCWPTTACFPFYLLNLKGLGCFSRLPESVNLLQCWINENFCLRRKHLVKRVSLPKKKKRNTSGWPMKISRWVCMRVTILQQFLSLCFTHS